MTLSEKIYQLRPKVNYDKDKDIRDTLEFPYDFNRAVEYAVRTMCKKAKISLKAVFVPFVGDSQYFNAVLDNAGATGFEIVAPKNFHILVSDGSIIEVTQEEIESVISDTSNLNLELYRIALRKFGDIIKIQSNIEVGSQPVIGSYDSIASFPAANKITTVALTAPIGNYVINLSKANENKYSSAMITDVFGTTLTLDVSIQTATTHLWTALDKIYVTSGLPYLMVLFFQGLPKAGYFDTYTTIPIDDVYLDYIDAFALEYLYEIIKARFQEQTPNWIAYINKGKDSIKEIKALANKRSSFSKVKPYIPFIQEYGA